MKMSKQIMPKQSAPVVRNLNTTVQSADTNGVEASFPLSSWMITYAIRSGKAIYNAIK